MPNHVYSLITVIGPAADVARFRDAARGSYPRNGDVDGANYTDPDKPPKVVEFCAHSLVPLPPEFSQFPYGDGGRIQGINMEREMWGIKWGTWDESPPVEDRGLVTYHVYTPWSPPETILRKTAPRWPTLAFILSWKGEGPTRGRMEFRGKTVGGGEHKYVKSDYPSDGDYGDERESEYNEAYKAIADHYFDTHWQSIGLRLSEMGDGTHPGIVADWLGDYDFVNHETMLRQELVAG